MLRLGWSQCIVVAVCVLVVRSQANEVLPIPLDAAPTPTSTPFRPTPIGLASGVTLNPVPSPPNVPTPKLTASSQPQITTVVTDIPPADALPPSADNIKPNSATLSGVLKNQVLTTSPPASSTANSGYLAYQAASSAFNALNTLGGGCSDSCNVLKGVSFRQFSTKFYLTADNSFYLSFKSGESPSPQQLFTAKQNADCTWSFIASNGLYISLNTAFSYLTMSSQLSVGERFYMERNKDWIYVESANSYRNFWTASNGIALYAMNSAARFVMEIWPMLNVGWN